MYTALIMAAGSGARTRLPFNKMFYELRGKPMVLYSVDRFSGDSDCGEVIVVHAAADTQKMCTLLKGRPNVKPVIGGATRQESVCAGLKVAKHPCVLIHDGARPNLKRPLIEALKKALGEADAATAAIPVRDTTVEVDHGEIIRHYDRKRTYSVQTPQAFRTEEILKAHLLVIGEPSEFTDDTSVYLAAFPQKTVRIVPGDEDNVKVTTQSDLSLIEGLL